MLTQNTTQMSETSLSDSSRGASLVGIFLILLSVVAFTFFIRPFGQKVDAVKADVAGKTQELNDLKQQVFDMENAENTLGLASELERLEMLSLIPVGLKQDEAIKDVVRLAEDNNITLTSIGFGKGMTDREKIGALQISSSFDGTYEDLISFLKALEQNKRMFKVNSVSAQLMDTDVMGLKRAVFALSIETFYQE
jgi:Tfp pilus assembly protein PilO